MSDIAIRVENLGKKYRLGKRGASYRTLRDSLSGAVVAPFRRLGSAFRGYLSPNGDQTLPGSGSDGTIWALKDFYSEVKQGEVIGIIGRNGAGKSTLLKILARITEPTTGFADIQGRIGSLLEVGTGFHPELNGRENIYLNGAILGMKRAEIDRKFDEIVAFAETEKFVDTPVKHYSSGMYLRLAFAVAAHLEPEILLVDEVLAVGDAAFQKKCLGKMGDVAKQGRTVLFVSHNMSAIVQLCGRALWIDDGQLRLGGPPSEVVGTYLLSGAANCSTWINSSAPSVTQPVQVLSARILSDNSQLSSVIEFDKKFKVEIEYRIVSPVKNLHVRYRVTDCQGTVIWTAWDTDTTNLNGAARSNGRYRSVCQVPANLLRPGRYLLSVGAGIPVKAFADHDHILAFDVSDVGYHLNPDRLGIVTPVLDWEIERLD